MARIMYDRYLTDADCSVNITNADTEYLTTTVPESFINPPIKMRFLSTGGKSFEELEYLTLGTLRKAVQEGDVVNGTIMAGQIAGMVSKEQTCKEMIEEMMEQASALLGK